jgi:hypothetical protein
VVHIEIDDSDPLETAILEHTRRYRDVVERAEALAVVRKCMVQTAADVTDDVEV